MAVSRHHMAVCTVRGPALAGRGSKQHGGCPLSFGFSWLAPQPVYVYKSVASTQEKGLGVGCFARRGSWMDMQQRVDRSLEEKAQNSVQDEEW